MLKRGDFKKEIKIGLKIIIILSTLNLVLKTCMFVLGKYSVLDMSLNVIEYFIEIMIVVFMYNKVIKPLEKIFDDCDEEFMKNENINIGEKDR